MKRQIIFLLTLAVLLSFAGCGKEEEPVIFYYPRVEVAHTEEHSVIAPETRDALSRDESLNYLLRFYLDGPIDSSLRLPVPEDTEILRIIPYENGLVLVMSQHFNQLEGMDLTIACGSLAATCFELTDTQQITFAVGTQNNVIRLVTRDSLIMTDDVTKAP